MRASERSPTFEVRVDTCSHCYRDGLVANALGSTWSICRACCDRARQVIGYMQMQRANHHAVTRTRPANRGRR